MKKTSGPPGFIDPSPVSHLQKKTIQAYDQNLQEWNRSQKNNKRINC